MEIRNSEIVNSLILLENTHKKIIVNDMFNNSDYYWEYLPKKKNIINK